MITSIWYDIDITTTQPKGAQMKAIRRVNRDEPGALSLGQFEIRNASDKASDDMTFIDHRISSTAWSIGNATDLTAIMRGKLREMDHYDDDCCDLATLLGAFLKHVYGKRAYCY